MVWRGDISSDWVETGGDRYGRWEQLVEGNDPVKQVFPVEKEDVEECSFHSYIVSPHSGLEALWLFITRILTRSKTVWP